MPEKKVNSKRLVIRNARADEFDGVALLLKDAYKQYANSIPPERWAGYLEDIMDVRGRQDAELIVAEMDGRLAGSVTLYLDRIHFDDGGWPEGWAGIRLLGVHPKYRGKGIGRALMDECLRRARTAGFKTIGLHTTELMAIARRLYERMGFVRVPEYDFLPAPDVVVMAYKMEMQD